MNKSREERERDPSSFVGREAKGENEYEERVSQNQSKAMNREEREGASNK